MRNEGAPAGGGTNWRSPGVTSKKKSTTTSVKAAKSGVTTTAARTSANGGGKSATKAQPVSKAAAVVVAKKKLGARPVPPPPKAVVPTGKPPAKNQSKTPTNGAPVKAVGKLPPTKSSPPPKAIAKPAPPPEPPKPKPKPGKGLNPQQMERMKGLLLDRRKEILGRKTNTEAAAEELAEPGGDSADRAAVSVDRDFMAESQVRDAKSLKDIDEALVKLASGTYGNCEECGATIGLKRLEYLPNAAYCIECQEKFEEQGLYPEPASGGEDFRLVE
jgi:DnaK suppressor protein